MQNRSDVLIREVGRKVGMKKATVGGLIIGIGLLVLLKVFQHSIPRISDPLTNYIILIGFVLLVIIFGATRLRKSTKRN